MTKNLSWSAARNKGLKILKQILLALIPLFLFHANALASSPSFRYKAYMPAGVDCAKHLNDFAFRFEVQARAKVISRTCVASADAADPDKLVAAVLIYERATGAIPTTVTFGFNADVSLNAATGESVGAYQMKIDCDVDLDHQIALFKHVTGIEPFTSYCERDQLSSSYVLKIETFGATEKQLYVFMTSDDSPTDVDLAAIASRIGKTGVIVARAYQNTVYFYDNVSNDSAASRLKLKSDQVAVFADESECQSQRLVLTHILPADTILFCTQGLASVLDSVSPPSTVTYETFPSAAYGSLTECLTDVQRVLAQEQRRTSKIAGAICSYTGEDSRNPYTIQLVKRN